MKFEKVTEEQYMLCCAGHAIEEKEYERINIPKRATRHSAGYDFFAPFSFSLFAGDSIIIPTGIRAKLDDDMVLLMFPRSSLGWKYRAQFDNTIPVIDADFYDTDCEGHIRIKITNDSIDGAVMHIQRGDAIAQGIVLRYCTTENDNTTSIRTGGFGSTDNRAF